MLKKVILVTAASLVCSTLCQGTYELLHSNSMVPAVKVVDAPRYKVPTTVYKVDANQVPKVVAVSNVKLPKSNTEVTVTQTETPTQVETPKQTKAQEVVKQEPILTSRSGDYRTIERTDPKARIRMDEEVYHVLKVKGEEYGLPVWVWYPIVMTECKGQPATVTSSSLEVSIGVFQVNTKVHKTPDPVKLRQPAYNADYQMPTLKRVFEQGKAKGLQGLELARYTARYGQRPQWSTYYINSMATYYNEVMQGEITLVNKN